MKTAQGRKHGKNIDRWPIFKWYGVHTLLNSATHGNARRIEERTNDGTNESSVYLRFVNVSSGVCVYVYKNMSIYYEHARVKRGMKMQKVHKVHIFFWIGTVAQNVYSYRSCLHSLLLTFCLFPHIMKSQNFKNPPSSHLNGSEFLSVLLHSKVLNAINTLSICFPDTKNLFCSTLNRLDL